MTLRAARPEEAAALSALAMRSKAHWGYDEDFLASVRTELTWTAGDIERADAVVEEREDALVGFALRSGTPPDGVLDAVFVDPGRIGQGIGRLLLAEALRRARTDGFRSLTVEADPHAEGFYLGAGGVRVGSVPSGSIAGRVLPLLRFDLGDGHREQRSTRA